MSLVDDSVIRIGDVRLFVDRNEISIESGEVCGSRLQSDVMGSVSISTLEFAIMAPFSCQSKFYNNLDHWREQSHRVPPPQSSHRRGQILSTRKNLSRLTPSRLPLNADKPSANLTIQRRAMGQFPCS